MITKGQSEKLLSLVQALRAADEDLEIAHDMGYDCLKLSATTRQEQAYNAWLAYVDSITENENGFYSQITVQDLEDHPMSIQPSTPWPRK